MSDSMASALPLAVALTGGELWAGVQGGADVRVTSALIATYVAAHMAGVAPATLNEISELAAAIGSDPNFAVTMATALAGKQPLDGRLSAIAGLTFAADKGVYFTGATAAATFDLTATGRALCGAIDPAAARTAIGLPIGTSGATVPLLNAANTWSATQTITGSLIQAGPTSATSYHYIRTDAGFRAGIILQTGTSDRWTIRKGNGAESGSNAGSDLEITRATDAGAGIDVTFSISRATGVVAAANGLQPGSLTVAGLPAASARANVILACSNLGGGAGLVFSDGAAWRRISAESYQAIATDAAATYTYTYLTSATTQRLSAALTATRTVTLTAGAPAGARARFVRDVAATGAFNWAIGSLKNLTAGTWCDIESDGTNWFLASAGAL